MLQPELWIAASGSVICVLCLGHCRSVVGATVPRAREPRLVQHRPQRRLHLQPTLICFISAPTISRIQAEVQDQKRISNRR